MGSQARGRLWSDIHILETEKYQVQAFQSEDILCKLFSLHPSLIHPSLAGTFYRLTFEMGRVPNSEPVMLKQE